MCIHLLVVKLGPKIHDDLIVTEVGMSWQNEELTPTAQIVKRHWYWPFIYHVELWEAVPFLNDFWAWKVNTAVETQDEVTYKLFPRVKIIVFKHVAEVLPEISKKLVYKLVFDTWLELT